MKRLLGVDTQVSETFMDGQNEGMVKVYGLELEMNEDLIAKVSNTLDEGRKFYKEGKYANGVVDISFELGVRENMRKNLDGGF